MAGKAASGRSLRDESSVIAWTLPAREAREASRSSSSRSAGWS